MEWLGMLLDTVVGGLPSAAAALCPDHLKRRWQQRLARQESVRDHLGQP